MRSGNITGWNKQSESLFGWRRDEAVGRLLTETIIPKRYHEAHRDGLSIIGKLEEERS